MNSETYRTLIFNGHLPFIPGGYRGEPFLLLRKTHFGYAHLCFADHTDQDNCCKHESKSFKIKDSHITVNTTVLSPSVPATLPPPVYQAAIHILAEQDNPISYQANAPPGNLVIPIYTLNCAYRI